jgi:hypothetical protein
VSANQVNYGRWTFRCGDGDATTLLSTVTANVMQGYCYCFTVTKTEPLPDGVRLTGFMQADSGSLTMTITTSGGKVHVHAQAAHAKTSYIYRCIFAAGDLAQTDVGMDARTIHISATRKQVEYPHARHFLFFAAQPVKTLGIDIATCDFADMNNSRADDDGSFHLMLHPDAAGTLDFTIDLTKSTYVTPREAYAGARLINTDDLHLPDLTLSRNLVQNPGFEGGFSLWGDGYVGGTLPPAPISTPCVGWALDMAVAHSGTQSARYTIARGDHPATLCTYPLAVHPGSAYTVSFYARTDTPGTEMALFAQSVVWGQFPFDGDRRFPLTRDWQRFVATFTAPNAFLRLCFGDRKWGQNTEGEFAGAHIWLDDVQCEEGATATAFTQKSVFCSVTTGSPNECIPLDEPHPALQVSLTNTSDQPARCAATVSVENLARTPLLTQRIAARLAPWQSTVRTISLQPVPARGILRVVMAASAGAYRETFYGRFTRYARIPDAGKLRYGVHLEPADVRDFDFLQSYGVSGALSFELPSDPSIITAAKARNLLFVTDPTALPDCPVHIFTEAMTEAKWRTYDAWLGSKITPSYRDQLYWKTLNEPNCGGYVWTPADNVRAISLMRKYIKALNPKALILSPDPWDDNHDGRSWLEQFFRAGGNKLVDVVAIHNYSGGPESPDLDHNIQSLIALKAKYGLAHAPIMFTEGEGVPIYTLPEIGMSPFDGFWEWRLNLLGLDVGRSELAGAAEITRILLACLKNDDQVKFYLNWRNDFDQQQPYASLGAVNFLLATLRHADFQREYQAGGQTKTYLFQTPTQQPVAVCWCYDLKIDRGDLPPMVAHMPAPGAGWRLLDIMGNPVTPSVTHGVWSFPVSGLPVYLLGPHGALLTAQRLLGRLKIYLGMLLTQ